MNKQHNKDWKQIFLERFVAFEEPNILDGFATDEIIEFIKQEKQLSFEAGAKAEREKVDPALDNAFMPDEGSDLDKLGEYFKKRTKFFKQLSHNKGEK